MRLFVQNGWKQPSLHALNLCRMYLKVFLLSDIVSGAGDQILPQFWKPSQPATSTLDWLRTVRLSPHAWALWHQALSSSLHLGWNLRLAQSLGKWFSETRQCGWYYHRPTNSLWEISGQQWHCYGSIPQRTRQLKFHGSGQHDNHPPQRWRWKKQ